MSDNPNVKRGKLSDLKPLVNNPNAGSERAQYMLEESFTQAGAGRSILIAANGDILAGNHASEAYGQLLGNEDVLIVETDGKTLVAVKRTDIASADDPKGKTLIIADNRASDFHEYDKDVLAGLLETDKELLETYFHDWELDKLIKGLQDQAVDYEQEWQDMPEFVQEGVKLFRSLLVHFKTLEDFQKFTALINQTLTDKTKYIYYPEQQKQNRDHLRIIDES